MCLDYNDTIDNLIPKCIEHENGGRFPTFFRGVLSMALATKSTVSIAIISSAQVEGIKDDVNIINYYANMYCKLAIGDTGNLINYIVGDKCKEIYNCSDASLKPLTTPAQSKKDGVEAVLNLPSEQGTNLLITGGDTKEDLAMIEADTNGIPNVFIAPKANKEIIDGYPDTITIRDAKNNNSEGTGRCLITLSRSLEEYNLTNAFNKPASQVDILEPSPQAETTNQDEVTTQADIPQTNITTLIDIQQAETFPQAGTTENTLSTEQNLPPKFPVLVEIKPEPIIDSNLDLAMK